MLINIQKRRLTMSKDYAQSQRMLQCRLQLGCRDAMDFYKKYADGGRLFSYQKYQKHESGERALNEKSAMLYAEIYRVDWKWLLNGGEKSDMIQIDMVDAVACCGNGIVNFETNVIGRQSLSLTALKELTPVAPENIKILKVVGDSMEPTISSGDFVWVDISSQSPVSDGIYLFCIGDRLVVKRLQINPFDNSVEIMSDNTKYKPLKAMDYQMVNVVGRVISYTKMIG